jgi:hypothetical protein
MLSQSNSNWLNGSNHAKALWLYLFAVLAHWLEHLCQMYQIYVLGWMPKAAGGVLGLWYPWLNSSELLHVGYNSMLWGGLLFLRPGFEGRSRRWWNVALALQSFHLFEHLLLWGQYLTGVYLFGAEVPTSIGQLWVRRPELHFMYNLAVFIPMITAVWMHWQVGGPGGSERAESQDEAAKEEALAAA